MTMGGTLTLWTMLGLHWLGGQQLGHRTGWRGLYLLIQNECLIADH